MSFTSGSFCLISTDVHSSVCGACCCHTAGLEEGFAFIKMLSSRLALPAGQHIWNLLQIGIEHIVSVVGPGAMVCVGQSIFCLLQDCESRKRVLLNFGAAI